MSKCRVLRTSNFWCSHCTALRPKYCARAGAAAQRTASVAAGTRTKSPGVRLESIASSDKRIPTYGQARPTPGALRRVHVAMTPFWPPARRARTVLSLNKDAGVSPGCDTLLEPFRAAAANAMEGLDLPNVIYRFASGVLVVALAAVLGGCSNPAGSTSSVTDTFNGTVGSTGFDSHSVTVNNSGDVDATPTALQPQPTTTVGCGIGQPTSTGCSRASYSESAR